MYFWNNAQMTPEATPSPQAQPDCTGPRIVSGRIMQTEEKRVVCGRDGRPIRLATSANLAPGGLTCATCPAQRRQ